LWQNASDIFKDSGALLARFIDGAEAAVKARDVAVEVIQEVFETGPLNSSNFTLPNNVTINATLPPDLVANAKYVVNNIDFRQRASEVLARLYELEDMIEAKSAELYGRCFNPQSRVYILRDGSFCVGAHLAILFCCSSDRWWRNEIQQYP
jgi:hypothetical protein